MNKDYEKLWKSFRGQIEVRPSYTSAGGGDRERSIKLMKQKSECPFPLTPESNTTFTPLVNLLD